MKKILVVRGQSAYNVLSCATDEICKGFENCGYQVDLIDTQALNAEEDLCDALDRKEEYAFYFSMEAICWNLECSQLPQLSGMERVGWLAEDPVFHDARLLGSTGKKAHVLTVQESFAERIEKTYPKFDSVDTLYHGGFAGTGQIPWKEKDIDVFFPGSYLSERKSVQDIHKIEGAFGVIATNVMKRMAESRQWVPWDLELQNYLKEIGFEYTDDELPLLLRKVYPLDYYQRALVRKRMLEPLLESGIRVSVVGNGWDQYEGKGKENLDIISATGVDIHETAKLMQRSKIVLHNTNFECGMHERIFTAMLAKAICVSSENECMKRFFQKDKEMVMYAPEYPKELPDKVRELLVHPKMAEEIANAGYQAAQNQTWQRRGEQIAHWMEDGKPFVY
jgi:hypothetical protein